MNNSKPTQAAKYLFAAYANLAQHNTYLTINEILRKIKGIESIGDDANIFSMELFSESFKNNTEADTVARIIDELHRAFPFVEPAIKEFLYKTQKAAGITSGNMRKKADPSDYYAFFELLFNALKNTRNDYTHAYHELHTFDSVLLDICRAVFDAGVYKIKERFDYTETVVAPLRRKGKAKGERTDFKYKFGDKHDNLSEHGLAFFICMFLEPKYAYLFLGQLKDFKDASEPTKKALFEVYSVYAMRMPQTRINGEWDMRYHLFMDMVGELHRCPRILFNTLSDADKKTFKPIQELNEDGDYVPEFALTRHNDRFSYFALQYFDRTKTLETLRFGVDLGNFYYKVYPKTVLGEADRNRRLGEKIVAYGYLSDFDTDAMPDTWKTLRKDPATIGLDYPEPYLVETIPHYHFHKDNIPIKIIAPNATQNKWYDLEAGVKPKIDTPDLFISKNELISMAFYAVLQQNNRQQKSTESIILDYRTNILRFFNDFTNGKITTPFTTPIARPKNDCTKNYDNHYKKGSNIEYEKRKITLENGILKTYSLSIQNIPETLRDYLLRINITNTNPIATARIEKRLENTERRLAEIDRAKDKTNRKNRIGRSEYIALKSGKLATFLIKDMMYFQPSLTEGKDKVTGKVYQVLQKRMAFFGGYKDGLYQDFKNCNLVESANEHPFLKNIAKNVGEYRDILSFYFYYLKERQKYLEGCLAAKNYSAYQWLRLKPQKITPIHFQKLAKWYAEHPILLPRNLFIQPIQDILSKTSAFGKILYESKKNNQSFNTIYLAQKYLELVEKDSFQPFYDFKRNYEVFDKRFDGRKKNEMRETMPAQYFTKDERITKRNDLKNWINSDEEKKKKRKRLFLDYDDNEKKIRQIQTQDIVLLLMAKAVWKAAGDAALLSVNIDTQMHLADMQPNTGKGILEQFIPCYYTYNLPKSEIAITVLQPQLKMKNYGDFRRFARDRRLPELLAYYQKTKDTSGNDTINSNTFDAVKLKADFTTNYPDTDFAAYIDALFVPTKKGIINRIIVKLDLIKRELEQYDRARVPVFKAVHAFENMMYSHFKTDIDVFAAEQDRDIRLQKYGEQEEHNYLLKRFFEYPHYQEIIDDYCTANKITRENLNMNMLNIRNKFGHNQFPEFNRFSASIKYQERKERKERKETDLANYFIQYANNTYQFFSDKIEKKNAL